MGIDLTEISQKVLDNNTNAANVFRKMYDLHYNPNPLDMPFEYIDENGNKVTTNIPNKAKDKKTYLDIIGAAIAKMNVTFYVDAENGNDLNPGTADAPFKTIKKASDSIPVGGKGNINLSAGEHIIDNSIFLYRKTINLYGNRDNETIIKNVSYKDDYGTATTGFLMLNSYLGLNVLTARTAPLDDDGDGLSYYCGFINRRIDGFIGTVAVVQSSIEFDDTPFCRLSDRTTGNFIFYSYNYVADKDTFNCIGSNRNGEIIYNEKGTMRIDFSNVTSGTDKDGNDLDYKTLITGIVKDADSGNPINLISNVNFSD